MFPHLSGWSFCSFFPSMKWIICPFQFSTSSVNQLLLDILDLGRPNVLFPCSVLGVLSFIFLMMTVKKTSWFSLIFRGGGRLQIYWNVNSECHFIDHQHLTAGPNVPVFGHQNLVTLFWTLNWIYLILAISLSLMTDTKKKKKKKRSAKLNFGKAEKENCLSLWETFL